MTMRHGTAVRPQLLRVTIMVQELIWQRVRDVSSEEHRQPSFLVEDALKLYLGRAEDLSSEPSEDRSEAEDAKR